MKAKKCFSSLSLDTAQKLTGIEGAAECQNALVAKGLRVENGYVMLAEAAEGQREEFVITQERIERLVEVVQFLE